MGVLRLSGFTGMWPERDPRALPDNAATSATNVRSEGGAYMKGIRTGALIKTLAANTKNVFRLPNNASEQLSASYWMEFTDIDTNVIPSPIVNDDFNRIYWASPSQGLRYRPRTEVISGSAGYLLGVTEPNGSPNVAVDPGTGDTDSDGNFTGDYIRREYLVTFITIYGEESAPSGAGGGRGYHDQDWLVTNIPQPGAVGSRAPIDKIRLYRTVTSLQGLTSFFEVTELAVGVTSFTDDKSDFNIGGNIILASEAWIPPPGGGRGLLSMPNGIFVTWRGNDIYFCENYRPHAWPDNYKITVDHDIIGLGLFGNSCVICTVGAPCIVTGTRADSMTLSKFDKAMPCLSRQSIVSTAEGVYYASQDGLAFIGPQGARVITEGLFNRKQWLAPDPKNYKAIEVEGRYIAAGNDTAIQGLSFQPMNPQKEGVTYIAVSGGQIVNFIIDMWSGKPAYIQANQLWEWEPVQGALLTYEWKSKEFSLPAPTNFSVFQIFFDDTNAQTVTVKIEALLRGEVDDLEWTVAYEATVTGSGREVKMAAGFKSDTWRLTLGGNATIQSFVMATRAKELRGA